MVHAMRLLFSTFLFLSSAGCGGDDDGVAGCIPGMSVSCACLGGAVGVQECADDGTFGECRCPMGPDTGPTPGVDAGPMPGVDAGPTPAVDSGPTPGADAGPPGPDAGPVDVPGHVVVFGAPIWQADESFDLMFANAIFLTARPGDTDVDVVEYTEHVMFSGFEVHARDVMDAEAAARGRTLVRTSFSSSTGLAPALAGQDVLFLPVQNADEMTIRTIATFWHDTLVSFVDAGGVIVVLGRNGTVPGGGRHGERYFVDAPEFFGFSTLTPSGFSTGMSTQFEITDAADPIATGVLSPWASNAGEYTCFPGSSRGRVVARSLDASLCPIVRHLVR